MWTGEIRGRVCRIVRAPHREGAAGPGPRTVDRVGAAGGGGATGGAKRLSAGHRRQCAGAGALRALRLRACLRVLVPGAGGGAAMSVDTAFYDLAARLGNV